MAIGIEGVSNSFSLFYAEGPLGSAGAEKSGTLGGVVGMSGSMRSMGTQPRVWLANAMYAQRSLWRMMRHSDPAGTSIT